jgi:hypothetical protein
MKILKDTKSPRSDFEFDLKNPGACHSVRSCKSPRCCNWCSCHGAPRGIATRSRSPWCDPGIAKSPLKSLDITWRFVGFVQLTTDYV